MKGTSWMKSRWKQSIYAIIYLSELLFVLGESSSFLAAQDIRVNCGNLKGTDWVRERHAMGQWMVMSSDGHGMRIKSLLREQFVIIYFFATHPPPTSTTCPEFWYTRVCLYRTLQGTVFLHWTCCWLEGVENWHTKEELRTDQSALHFNFHVRTCGEYCPRNMCLTLQKYWFPLSSSISFCRWLDCAILKQQTTRDKMLSGK